MNDHEISIILCTNDPLYLAEAQKYIRRLTVPDGFSVALLPVEGAPSMCAGYNAAMRQSDAKYKIYMHQDTMILNRHFLENIVELFRAHPQAGMIGMVGPVKLSSNAIMWKTGQNELGALYAPSDEPYVHERVSDGWATARVACADGFLIATQADVPWREDLFDGWDFYDASQGMEFNRHGYEILVPEQKCPWCLHDDGRILNLYRYAHYRRIFLEEYWEDLRRMAAEEQTDSSGPDPEADYIRMLEDLERNAPLYQAETKRILHLADVALSSQNVEMFLSIPDEFGSEPGRSALPKSGELLRLKQMAEAVRSETKLGLPTFIDGVTSQEAFREKVLSCTFALRDIELDAPDEELEAALACLRKITPLSAAAIIYNIISSLGQREKLLLTLASDALDQGDVQRAYEFLAAVQNPSPDTVELLDELKKALS